MNRRLSKAVYYYRCEGAIGLVFAILRSALIYPRTAYRSRRWRRFLRRNDDVVNLKNGFRVRLNRRDTGLSVELASEGTHEPILTGILQRLVAEGATVVDVGANLGYFALLAARAAGQSGKVIALEPSPTSFELLLANVQLNNATNVSVRPEAAGDQAGNAELFLFRQANWNSLVDLDETSVDSVVVQVLALDDLLADEQNVDVVRMDVEGYEGRVLAGMRRILRVKRPFLVAEIHALSQAVDFAAFFRILIEFEYEVAACYPRIKDEIYWGRTLVKPGGFLEKPKIDELLKDRRLVEFKEDFTAVFVPKAELDSVSGVFADLQFAPTRGSDSG